MNHAAISLSQLEADTPVLFISDPTGGDQLHVGRDPAQLQAVPVPDTAEGAELGTAEQLLDALDFEAYAGDDPQLFDHRS